MLWGAKLTNGIGVRIAHNTPCMSIKDVRVVDRVLTSVNNAKQKKTTKTAQHKDQTPRNRLENWVFLMSRLV